MPTIAPSTIATSASARARSVRALLTQFALVAFLVVAAGLILGKLAVDTTIRRVEADEMADNVTRAQAAFDRLVRRARVRVEDYAFWDETVRLAQNPGAPGATGFFRRNFVGWLPLDDYDFIELLDSQRASAFSWATTPATRRPSWTARAPFFEILERDGVVGGYAREGDDLYLVAGAAVYASRVAGSRAPENRPRGYLVLGRSIGESTTAALQPGLRVGLRLHPPGTAMPVDGRRGEALAVGDSLRTFFTLTGVAGAPVAVVELLDSRTELHRISRWTLYGAVVGLAVIGGALLLIWLYGQRLLITPLRHIAAELGAMHERGELAEVRSAPPSAEWALFLSTFNATVRSLRDSEQRYGALFDRAVDPYFLLDAGTRLVVDANPAAAAVVGVPRESLVGASLPEALRARPDHGGAIRVRRPDGTTQTWGVAETDVTIGDRGLVLAAYRDLTDRESVAQTQKMDAIGSLAGGIAHDFNNLMGSVLAGVRVARQSLATDRRGASALDAIEHAGRRAADLTRRLLGVSRHEPLVRVPVDVTAAIANIERICASTFDRRIRITVSEPLRLPSIDGDPGQVEQALLNLCINARDAMPSGGTLRLGARFERLDADAALRIRDVQPGPYVVLSVEDDGAGMTDDVKQRIFEPFFTTKASGKGTGLGLAMVYGFARSAGGTIVVDSTPGTGTRFDLYLPASRSGAALKTPLPEGVIARPTRTGGEQAMVLLVDDEPELREMLRLVLEQEGYGVVLAANGEEALDRLPELGAGVAVALLDVQMPVLGGLDTLARLRVAAPSMPVVLGTGYVGDAELAALRDAGADDLVTKPYDIPDLLDRLARLTGARAAHAPP